MGKRADKTWRVTVAVVAVVAAVAAGVWWLWPATPALSPNPATAPIQPSVSSGESEKPPAQGPRSPAYPGPHRPVDLGQGQPLAVELADGAAVVVTWWPAARPASPLLVLLAGDAAEGEAWLPLARTLRGHRDLAVALVAGERPGRPIDDRRARTDRGRKRLEAVVAALRLQPAWNGRSLSVLAADEDATAALLFAESTPTRALVVLSPRPPPAPEDLDAALAALTRRQILLAVAGGDADAVQMADRVAKHLENLQSIRVSGAASGVALLEGATLSRLAGWLYAALGPVQAHAGSATLPPR